MRCAVRTLTIITLSLTLCAVCTEAQTIDTIWTGNYWNGYWDSLSQMVGTADKGFVMTGPSQQLGASHWDCNLVKVDSLGHHEWTQLYGDTVHTETGLCVEQTSDGGYVIGVQTDSIAQGQGSVWVIRTDADGDTLWNYYHYVGGINVAVPLDIVETYDSGFVITGWINVPGKFDDVLLFKLDKNGDREWVYNYGDGYYQDGRWLCQMPDSGFFVVGAWDKGFGDYDWHLWRFDDDGTYLWDSTYVLSSSYDEVCGACLDDDGIVMVGTRQGAGYMMKVDLAGNTLWGKSISKTPNQEKCRSVLPDDDGGYVVGGFCNVEFYRRNYSFIKTDSVGDTVWTFATGGFEDDHGKDLARTHDGLFALCGSCSSWQNGTSYWLVAVGEAPMAFDDRPIEHLPTSFALHQNYPNPFNPSTRILFEVPESSFLSIKIYNVLGQHVKTLLEGEVPAGAQPLDWDGTDKDGRRVPSGAYFCQLRSGETHQTIKMMVLK